MGAYNCTVDGVVPGMLKGMWVSLYCVCIPRYLLATEGISSPTVALGRIRAEGRMPCRLCPVISGTLSLKAADLGPRQPRVKLDPSSLKAPRLPWTGWLAGWATPSIPPFRRQPFPRGPWRGPATRAAATRLHVAAPAGGGGEGVKGPCKGLWAHGVLRMERVLLFRGLGLEAGFQWSFPLE